MEGEESSRGCLCGCLFSLTHKHMHHMPPSIIRVTPYRGPQGIGAAAGEKAVEALAHDSGKCFPYHWRFPKIARVGWCYSPLFPTPREPCHSASDMWLWGRTECRVSGSPYLSEPGARAAVSV